MTRGVIDRQLRCKLAKTHVFLWRQNERGRAWGATCTLNSEMAKKRASNKPVPGDDSTGDGRESPDTLNGDVEDWSALDHVKSGEMVSVKRTYPPGPGAGWLENMEVPPGGAGDLPELIQQRWGGGRFVLQSKVRTANNSVQFGKMCKTINIAGPPVVPTSVETNPAPAPMQPFVVQAPPQAGGSQLQNQLLGLVTELSKQGNASVDVAGIANAMAQFAGVTQQQVPAPVSPMSQMGEMMGMFSKMQRMFDGRPEPAEQDDAALGNAFGKYMPIVEMFASKLAGGGMGGLLGGPQQQQQQPPMPPPPTPHHVYHPTAGWVHPSQLQPRPQPPAQPPPRPPPQAAPPAEGAVEVEPDHEAGGYDETPFTAEELAGELDRMDPMQLAKLVPLISQMPKIQKVVADAGAGDEKPQEPESDGINLTEYPSAVS